MKTRILGMGLAAAVVAIGVAGCGGDDSSTSSTSTAAALTQEEFVAQGNEICAAGNKELDAAGNDVFSGNASQAEVEQFATDALVPNIQGQIDDIRALQPPADQADQVTAFLDQAQSILDGVEADPSSIQGDPFAPVNKMATALGLDQCAG